MGNRFFLKKPPDTFSHGSKAVLSHVQCRAIVTHTINEKIPRRLAVMSLRQGHVVRRRPKEISSWGEIALKR
jgi:hypothetical protein